MIGKGREYISIHESYRDTYTETVEYIRKSSKFGSSHGDKTDDIEEESKLSGMIGITDRNDGW